MKFLEFGLKKRIEQQLYVRSKINKFFQKIYYLPNSHATVMRVLGSMAN